MQLKLNELIPNTVFIVEKDHIVSESDYHRVSPDEKVLGIEMVNQNSEPVAVFFQGEIKVLADFLIHTEYGAQGESISKIFLNILFIPDQATIQSFVQHFSPITDDEVVNQAHEWTKTEIQAYESSSDFTFINQQNQSSPSKNSAIFRSRDPPFTLINKNHKLVMLNEGQTLIRKGEDKLVDLGKERDILVSKPHKQVSISSEGIYINGQSLPNLIRSKMKR